MIKLPAKVLRAGTKTVTFPLKKDVKKLLVNMLETVHNVDGIGLAAPQVASNLNLALIYLENMKIPAFPIINPVILDTSEETVVVEEGCLSLPGVFGEVARPKWIKVKFQTTDGEEMVLEDDGWIARVILHEVDHLQGILIKDKFLKITKGKELLDKKFLN